MPDTPNPLLQNYNINRLPSLPHILIKLLNACTDDNISFEVISDLIGSDAALTAKIIAAANSPIYGHASQLTSLKHTLMFLGLETIKSIAITASVQQFFSKYDSSTGQQLAEFWQHSLQTALIAKNLAELLQYHSPDEVYLAALLHDIGTLVFKLDSQANYQTIIEQAHDTEQILALEQQHYQLSHAELGAHLLNEWGLSSFICDAVRYHHAAEDLIHDAHLLVKILNTANRLACLETADTFDCHIFDLSHNIITDIVKTSQQQLVKVSVSMGIVIHDKKSFDDKQVELAHQVKAIALSKTSLSQANEGLQFNIDYSCQLLFNIKQSCLFIYDNEKKHLNLETLQDDIVIATDSSSIINQCHLTSSISHSFDTSFSSLNIVDQQIINLLPNMHIICIPLQKNNVKYGVLAMSTTTKQLTDIINNKFQLLLFSNQLTDYYIQFIQNDQYKAELEHNLTSSFMIKAKEIAHEANNPLSVINNYLQILAHKFSHDDEINNDLKTIQTEIERVGSIILRCTEDDSETASDDAHTDINKIISELVNIYKYSLFTTHNTQCHLNLSKDLQLIHTNSNYLKQIISNLIKNAVESMNEPGVIEISTSKTNMNGNNFISISISDSGCGIPEHILSNIYQPVQTTKDNKHSGLGLSIVKNMIDAIQGSITCDTNNKGTKFTVLLPIEKK